MRLQALIFNYIQNDQIDKRDQKIMFPQETHYPAFDSIDYQNQHII